MYHGEPSFAGPVERRQSMFTIRGEMTKRVFHPDGSPCREGSASVPRGWQPCCEDFERHTIACVVDIRYEWRRISRSWGIAVADGGSSVVAMRYCPHCGARLQREGDSPMDEKAFWGRLEYRLCSELARRSEKELRGLWCDGIYPIHYFAEGRRPHLQGRAYFGKTGQEEWEFTHFVGRRVRRADELDWASLMPSEDVSGWLTLDLQRRTLTIDPTSRRMPIRVSSEAAPPGSDASSRAGTRSRRAGRKPR